MDLSHECGLLRLYGAVVAEASYGLYDALGIGTNGLSRTREAVDLYGPYDAGFRSMEGLTGGCGVMHGRLAFFGSVSVAASGGTADAVFGCAAHTLGPSMLKNALHHP